MACRALLAMKYTTRLPLSPVVTRNTPSSRLDPGVVGGNWEDAAEATGAIESNTASANAGTVLTSGTNVGIVVGCEPLKRSEGVAHYERGTSPNRGAPRGIPRVLGGSVPRGHRCGWPPT